MNLRTQKTNKICGGIEINERHNYGVLYLRQNMSQVEEKRWTINGRSKRSVQHHEVAHYHTVYMNTMINFQSTTEAFPGRQSLRESEIKVHEDIEGGSI